MKVRRTETKEWFNHNTEIVQELQIIGEYVGQEIHHGEFLVDAYIEKSLQKSTEPPSDDCPYCICEFHDGTPEFSFE